MVENATPKRRYDATSRRTRAKATHASVVDAAAQVFLAHGYAGATIALIAAEAGVALQTVYRAAPGKAGLLEAAVQSAVAGGVTRSMVTPDDRPAIQAIQTEPDPRVQLELYAHTQPGVWGRVGPLLRVLDAAAAAEPALESLREQHAATRYDGMRRFMTRLQGNGSLRPELSIERAADLIWTVCAQANYDALVVGRGWTGAEYAGWLTSTLQATLLPPDD